MNRHKIAIIVTHPIQYYSPLFELLTKRNNLQIKVFYTWEQSKEKVFDKKFGKDIKWDIPLLQGYDHTFVRNISKNPGSNSFKGVINPSLISEIKDWKATAILIFGWNHYSHLKTMRYFKGKIPIYFRGDSTLIDEKPGIKTILRRAWLNYIYRFIDYAFYVGTKNKEYYLKHGLTEKQLFFAPHAIDNDRFNAKNENYRKEAQKWRNKLGYAKKDIVFLFAGKFEKKKNPELLIDVALKTPEYKYLFVGNGVLEDKLKEKAKSFNNISFLDFQNQKIMPVIYHIGDIFVLPSNGPGETWGLAVNEAMACGKAILTSDKVGCAVDLVRTGKNGYIFKSNDVNDLQKKISIISKTYENFGNNSKEIIKNWSFDKIAESFEKHIKQNTTYQ